MGIERPRRNDMETTNLADLYHLDPIPWSRALKALESFGGPQHRAILATTPPDGTPPPAGVGALWDQGKVYIVSGEETRKSRNLAGNRACAVSMSLPELHLVVEGRAARVTDDETTERLAGRYAESGWPARVENGAFTYDYSAPSAGPPPWNLYEITPTTVFGVLASEPGGATRWRYGD